MISNWFIDLLVIHVQVCCKVCCLVIIKLIKSNELSWLIWIYRFELTDDNFEIEGSNSITDVMKRLIALKLKLNRQKY